MDNLRENISYFFKNALLGEARVLPSDADISSCPSIYKGVRSEHVDSYIEKGFQHQLAGDGGKAVGEGIYSRLEFSGAMRYIRSYGPAIIQGKVLGGFRNYIMFDASGFPSIRRQVERYYGDNIPPSEQVKRIVKDPEDAQKIIYAGKNINSGGQITKLCRKWGIRGMIYEWDSVATVLPFDFSSVIVWAVARNALRDDTLVRVFDDAARERYERTLDWDFQLYGRYDSYDRTKITRVLTNNEMYALVQDYSRGYNFVKLDTRITSNPKPQEISDIWLPKPPTLPGIRDGIFRFEYRGKVFFGTVFLPGENTPALWFPEDLGKLYQPDIQSTSDWVDLNMNDLTEVYEELRNEPMAYVSESLKNTFRKHLNEEIVDEEITDKDEQEFVSKHRCYVYRATKPSGFQSIFSNGQLRQFAGSNDGSWYGEGVYAVVNPQDVQYWKYDKETGKGGIKMIVLGGFNRFLVFDDTWAKRIYKGNYQIKDQVYQLFPKEVADGLWREMTSWMNNHAENCQYTLTKDPGSNRTTGMLHMMFNPRHGNAERFKVLFSKYNVRGAIYNGGNDGLSMVCWNFDQVIPYQYTTDRGQTWHSDLFNFEAAKERSFKNTDPVSKFRHLYQYVSDKIVACNVNGKQFNVTTVKTNNGRWNIININDAKGRKISPLDFDTEPKIGLSGLFNFVYKGVPLYGIVVLPGTNGGAVWYPEDSSQLNNRPNLNSLNDWVDFGDLDEVVAEIKSM